LSENVIPSRIESWPAAIGIGLKASAYDVVKTVFPETKVIAHVQNGYDNNLFRWLYVRRI